MTQQLTDVGLVVILLGALLIILGFIMLSRTGGDERHDRKSYAVFLIGPIPIIIKGGIKIAIITLTIMILIILLIFNIIGG